MPPRSPMRRASGLRLRGSRSFPVEVTRGAYLLERAASPAAPLADGVDARLVFAVSRLLESEDEGATLAPGRVTRRSVRRGLARVRGGGELTVEEELHFDGRARSFEVCDPAARAEPVGVFEFAFEARSVRDGVC